MWDFKRRFSEGLRRIVHPSSFRLHPFGRKLRVFLCHSSQDTTGVALRKPIVRELYQRLNAEGWIDPWLDEEKLLPNAD